MSVMSVIGEKSVYTTCRDSDWQKSDLIYKDLNERLGIERKDRPEASRARIDGGRGRGKKRREEARRPQEPVLPKSASLLVCKSASRRGGLVWGPGARTRGGNHDTDGQTGGPQYHRYAQSQFTNTNDGAGSAAYEEATSNRGECYPASTGPLIG